MIASMSAMSSFAFAQTGTSGSVNAGATVGADGARVGGAADINAGRRSAPGAAGARAGGAAGAQVDTGSASGIGASVGTGADAIVGSGQRGKGEAR